MPEKNNRFNKDFDDITIFCGGVIETTPIGDIWRFKEPKQVKDRPVNTVGRNEIHWDTDWNWIVVALGACETRCTEDDYLRDVLSEMREVISRDFSYLDNPYMMYIRILDFVQEFNRQADKEKLLPWSTHGPRKPFEQEFLVQNINSKGAEWFVDKQAFKNAMEVFEKELKKPNKYDMSK